MKNTTVASTTAMIASRTSRRLPKPRATMTNSTVEAMMNPAQPMITMCRITPALMMTNAVQSGASWPSWSSGTLRQPPASACHASTAPQSVSPQPMRYGKSRGPICA